MKKKLLLSLAVLSVFTLGSCSKKLDYEEAKTFASENYSKVELNYKSCKTKTVIDVKKAEGIYAKMFEVGKTEDEVDSSVDTYKYDVVSLDLDDTYTYSLNGKEMTVTKSMSSADYFKEVDDQLGLLDSVEAKVTGKGSKETYYFNEEGLLTKATVSIDMSFTMSSFGVTVNGGITMATTITNTYSK